MLSRRLATVTCKEYGETGHNKGSCKGKRAVEREIRKGGNKAKKAKTNKYGKGKKKTSENQAEIGHESQAPQATQDYMQCCFIMLSGLFYAMTCFILGLFYNA